MTAWDGDRGEVRWGWEGGPGPLFLCRQNKNGLELCLLDLLCAGSFVPS